MKQETGLLGEHLGKFYYYVQYSKPPEPDPALIPPLPSWDDYPPVPTYTPGPITGSLEETVENTGCCFIPPQETLPILEANDFDQIYQNPEEQDRAEREIVKKEIDEWMNEVYPNVADKLLYGNFNQDFHGMDARTYVEKHRDQQGKFDPYQLITSPGARVRIRIKEEINEEEVDYSYPSSTPPRGRRAGSEEATSTDRSELTHMMRELEQLKGQMKMMVQLMTAMVSSRGIEPTKLLPQVQQHKEEMDKQVKKKREFDPLPILPSRLLPELIASKLVTPMPPKPVNPQAPEFLLDARCEYHMGGIGHWTYDCYHHRHRIQDLLDHQLLSFYWRGRNAYYALKNPCPSLQDESESSSLCKKRKTSQIQPPISLKDRLVWPKVKDEDCTEINMICPPIRPQHRNCPDLHNVISQIVQNAPNRPTVVSYQGSAPRSTYLVPVPSQPQPLPLVITIPSASLTAPKVPQTLTLRPIPKPIVITYPPSKGPITISLPQLEPYTGNHAVPWNYGIEATTEQGEKIEPEVLLNAFNSLEKPSLLRKFSPDKTP